MRAEAEIGVFGGTGFYSLLEGAEELDVETPYGKPSAKITVGRIAERRVAFLPRHGLKHEYPPHMIPYRANIAAFEQLGVERLLAPCAVGSLQAHVKVGDLVICDQFVNFTHGRKDTFYDGPQTTHVSSADPYCPELRPLLVAKARELSLRVHETGTVAVIQGPRFSTRAESRFFRSQGWEVINMTQYPEVILAREMALCYVNLSLIVDYDVGLAGDPLVKPVSHSEVLRVFGENTAKLRDLILRLIPSIPPQRGCACTQALRDARSEG